MDETEFQFVFTAEYQTMAGLVHFTTRYGIITVGKATTRHDVFMDVMHKVATAAGVPVNSLKIVFFSMEPNALPAPAAGTPNGERG